MNSRDLKVGAIGAALSAAAFVSVYEGKVALSHASERVTLTAGETARLGGSGGSRGVEVTSGGHDDNAEARETDPLVAANANLVDSVSEYKRKLEALETQKAAIAKQLTEAQGKLALAQNDGQALPTKSPYDLTPDDWKEMAKEGKVVSRTPCASPAAWMPTPDQLAKDGLAPTDAQAIHDARAQSYGRVSGVIRPLCVQALQGDAKVADKLGPVTCSSLVSDVSRANGEDTAEELRAVAEMRAGMRPYDPSALGLYGQNPLGGERRDAGNGAAARAGDRPRRRACVRLRRRGVLEQQLELGRTAANPAAEVATDPFTFPPALPCGAGGQGGGVLSAQTPSSPRP